ncbi:MAG: YdeI/OmpD-associated family protein [Bacteroidetes bacterium]|nr:YdeI/OmpD-associated family protein [Bacteroidota bacterium]
MQCKLGATPECKIHEWQNELKTLRRIVRECGLVEDFKWMHPCYTYNGKNIVLIHNFNNYCALLFPKGVLLKDPENILIQQTENSQTARQIRFENISQITAHEASIKAYIFEAIEVEKAGIKVELKKTSDFDLPEELQSKFENDPAFKKAFYDLTPGRQRGYILHFSQPKQSSTREARIEKNIANIMNGKGIND